MADAEKLITEHLDLWSSAIKAKTSAGRGSSKKLGLYGISKLRELILDLAIRGMIVQQDESEGSASELMIEISRERDKQIREGNARKFKSTHSIKPDETPFSIPKTWEWVQLGDIQEFTNGFAFKSTDLHDGPGVGVVKIGDVYRNQGIGEHKMQFVTIDLANSIDDKYIIKPGEMVITMTGDVKVGFNRTQTNYLLNQRVGKIRCFLVNPKYIYFQLISVAEQKIKEASGGVIPNVSTSEINSTLISLPPLEEQHRIVAKVDELMALCDQLEEEQENNLETHETLVSTLLNTLTSAAADATEFADAWQRIQDNFDILFTTESSVVQLKKTILQLAVMGKLVHQDQEDEPAETLLRRISEAREALTTRGELKKQKSFSKASKNTNNDTLPKGWSLALFGDVLFNRDSERVPLSVEARKLRPGNFDYYGASGVIDSIDDYIFNKTLLLIGEDGANLINRSTPIAFIARGKYWVNNHAHVLDGISETLLLYICLHINSISLEPYVTGTAQPKMNQAKMNSIPLRIPPEKEQQRIILKVGELLALCDRLKASLSSAQETQLNLADSIVEQAIHSPA